jgi:WD40-like Beta Propeller Repeat
VVVEFCWRSASSRSRSAIRFFCSAFSCRSRSFSCRRRSSSSVRRVTSSTSALDFGCRGGRRRVVTRATVRRLAQLVQTPELLPQVFAKPQTVSHSSHTPHRGLSLRQKRNTKTSQFAGSATHRFCGGGKKPYPLVTDPSIQMAARFSPDGRWIAYQSDQLGRYEVFVKSFPPSDAKTQISTEGGSLPRWRRDGKELFYLAPDGKLMSVQIASDGQPSVPQQLFQTGLTRLYPRLRSYSVTENGDRFLISVPEDHDAAPSIVVASNWLAAIRSR